MSARHEWTDAERAEAERDIAGMQAQLGRMGEGIKLLAYHERRRSRERAVYAMTDEQRTDALLWFATSVRPGAAEDFDSMLRSRHPEVIADMTARGLYDTEAGK